MTSSIEIVLPGDSQFMHLARLMASGVAGTFGLPLTVVEDVRIAVDEVCATLIEVGDGHPIRLVFSMTEDKLEVQGTSATDSSGRPDADRLTLSLQMLDVLTDAHRFTQTDGQATFTITIRTHD